MARQTIQCFEAQQFNDIVKCRKGVKLTKVPSGTATSKQVYKGIALKPCQNCEYYNDKDPLQAGGKDS